MGMGIKVKESDSPSSFFHLSLSLDTPPDRFPASLNASHLALSSAINLRASSNSPREGVDSSSINGSSRAEPSKSLVLPGLESVRPVDVRSGVGSGTACVALVVAEAEVMVLVLPDPEFQRLCWWWS